MDKEMMAKLKNMPQHELMKMMAQEASRQYTEMFARMLTEISNDPRMLYCDGKTALLAAVAAIQNLNGKMWGE